MRLRLSLRHLMMATVAVALLASIAISMARSSAEPVVVRPAGPGNGTLITRVEYNIPLLPLLATVIGIWCWIYRLPKRFQLLAAIGTSLGLAGYVILVMELLERYR